MMKIKDRVVGKIEQKDIDSCMIPIIAIYDHPSDYPDAFVARLWDSARPTNTVMLKGTLEAMHAAIKSLDDPVYMKRRKNDDPKLVGVYLFC